MSTAPVCRNMALRSYRIPSCFALVTVVAFALAGCGSHGPAFKAQTAQSDPDPIATTASLSDSSFDFGENIVGNAVSQSVVTVTNTGASSLTMKPALTGDGAFSMDPAHSCGLLLLANSSCSVVIEYSPFTPSAPASQTASLALNFGNVVDGTPSTVNITGTAGLLSEQVSSTANPQVAMDTLSLPFAAEVSIEFGPGTGYGLATPTQAMPAGNPVSILVAGMLANTPYHLRASVTLPNGLSFQGADHVFTTGSLPAAYPLPITASDPAHLTPQPGIELFSTINGIGAFATDLSGNVIWTYPFSDRQSDSNVYPIKPLPNGHFLVLIQPAINHPLASPAPADLLSAAREIDLAGSTIRQLTVQQLNDRLEDAGYHLSLASFHHDISQLPNGHWLILANALKPFTDLPGYPGVTTVTGDAIIDVDQNLQPVWVWSAFDHLDVNRHPMNFPDWTHGNAVVYSADDGNLLFSMRHQHWVVKIDYRDGQGSGNVLWRLGSQGDFALVGGTDPVDWFYAQHDPTFFSSNTTGVFTLGIMDNGNNRVVSPGVVCGSPGAPPCYTTVPVLRIDEQAKTATLLSRQVFPPALYNFFGGGVQLLPNNNLHIDLCGLVGLPSSVVLETTSGTVPQTVLQLQLNTPTANIYRATRLPSLYPGVQWNGSPPQ